MNAIFVQFNKQNEDHFEILRKLQKPEASQTAS